MSFFSRFLILRVLLLWITSFVSAYTYYVYPDRYVTLFASILFSIGVAMELYYYVNKTNRQLSRFFNAVIYEDFSASYIQENKWGKSFKMLNQSLNKVMVTLREARAEKEEQYQVLQYIMNYVNIGLITFNQKGEVYLINQAALQYLQVGYLRNIDELEKKNPAFWNILTHIGVGKQRLFKESSVKNFAIHSSSIRLSGVDYKLVSIQNIYTELQQQEIESWQKLTSILRHEIVNSVSPITSLASTMQLMLKEDLQAYEGQYLMDEETKNDLSDASITIEDRAHAIVRFLKSYKDYTHLPPLEMEQVKLANLLNRVVTLMKPSFEAQNIQFTYTMDHPKLVMTLDSDKMEMVLINLLKNALESIQGKQGGSVSLRCYLDTQSRPTIEVEDNGAGIDADVKEKIFLPFFTTKKTGSGIGLSLSKQILLLHKGELNVVSELGKGSTFYIKL